MPSEVMACRAASTERYVSRAQGYFFTVEPGVVMAQRSPRSSSAVRRACPRE
jgi:hypothetical protein